MIRAVLMIATAISLGCPGFGASLLLVEIDDSKSDQTQQLVRYDFTNGRLSSRTVAFSTVKAKARFDLGKNSIESGRYIKNEFGDIVDIQTGAITHHKIEDEEGELSPDGKRRASGVMGSCKIVLLAHHRQKTLGDGYCSDLLFIANTLPKAPVLWLDNETLLSQRGNGTIVKVHLDGKFEAVVTIPGLGPAGNNPSFYRDPEGRIIYYCPCKAGEYLIDTKNKRYKPHVFESLGHGFEMEVKSDSQGRNGINYHNREIGRFDSSRYGSAATEGMIAVTCGDDGVKVWSKETGAWININPRKMFQVIGWLEK